MENDNREAGYRPEAVWLYSDGMYHWIYERDLHANRFETNYVLKVMGLVFGLSWVLMMGLLVGVGAEMKNSLMAFAIITAVCLGGWLLTAGAVRLGHMMSANANGGVEVIAFGMNEDGLRQIRYEGVRKAEEAVDRMLLSAGSAQGVLKAGDAGVTLFRNVRRMGLHPRNDLIDLTLKGNDKCRVYVRSEDYDFVRDYIRQRIRKGR